MKHITRRFLSLLLTLCLILSLVPTAFAASDDPESEEKTVFYAGETIPVSLGDQGGDVAITGYMDEKDWYVTDGLIMMYDGIYNAGMNQTHDYATEWKELTGNVSSLQISTTWNRGVTVKDSAATLGTVGSNLVKTFSNGFTVETAMTQTESMENGTNYCSPFNSLFGGSFMSFRPNNGPTLFYHGSVNWVASPFGGKPPVNQFIQYAASADGNDSRSIYLSGQSKGTKEGDPTAPYAITANTKVSLPVWTQKVDNVSVQYEHIIHLLRLYDRKLTDEEMAQNAAVDALRYNGNSYVVPGTVVVGTNETALTECTFTDGVGTVGKTVVTISAGDTLNLKLNREGTYTLKFEVGGNTVKKSIKIISQTDANAADNVKSQINALPAAETLTLSNLDAVAAAQSAYNALTTAQKERVGTEAKTKLDACVAKIDELASTGLKVTLTYDANGGTVKDGNENEVSSAQVSYKQTYTLAVPYRTNFRFDGWYLGDTKLTDANGNSLSVWSVLSGATVKAHWTHNVDIEGAAVSIDSAEDIYALARILAAAPDKNGVISSSASLESDYERLGFDAVSKENYEKLQSASYVLANAITLTDQNNTYHGIPNFAGTFDGNNKTITVNFDLSSYSPVGASAYGCLFSTLAGATVKNVTLAGSITGEMSYDTNSLQDIGVLAGYTVSNTDNIIENVTNNVNVTLVVTTENASTCMYIGSMFGRCNWARLSNCVNNGDFAVTFNGFGSNGPRVAGLIGHAYPGTTMNDCVNNGNVVAQGSAIIRTGGMAGTGNIVYTNCVQAGNVIGNGTTMVSLFPGLNASSTGNNLRLTVTGQAGETVAYSADASQSQCLGSEAVAFTVPITYDSSTSTVENAKFSYGQYLTVDGNRLDWFNLTNTAFTAKLSTDAAEDREIPFQTEDTALVLTEERHLLALQNAINLGDQVSIDSLYSLGGKAVSDGKYNEARSILQTAYYKLGNDITVTSDAFTGIGTSSYPFSGHLDGQEHLLDLTIHPAIPASNLGLFGQIGDGAAGAAVVENLKMDVRITAQLTSGNYYIGGLAGAASASTVLDGVKMNVKEIRIAGETSKTVYTGGLYGSGSILNQIDVDFTISGPVQVNGAFSSVSLGGAIGYGRITAPVEVVFSDSAEFSGASTSGSVNVGGMLGYNAGGSIDLRGSKLVNQTDSTLTITGAAGTSKTANVGGWIGTLNSATTTANDWVYVDGTTAMIGRFNVTADDDCAGGVLGSVSVSYSVSIEDYDNTCAVTANAYSGGLIGKIDTSGSGKQLCIINSTNSAAVSGNYSGSLAGYVGLGQGKLVVSGFENTGEITTSGQYIGGLFREINCPDATIENCLNTGAVKSTSTSSSSVFQGGLVGLLSKGTQLAIKNSANSGSITASNSGDKKFGGLVGHANNGTVSFEDSLYVKADNVSRAVGYPTTSVTGVVALDTTKLTDGIFDTAITDALSDAAPAALAIDGDAVFDGTSLIYKKVGQNQTFNLLWNGENMYTVSGINVTAKDLTPGTVTIKSIQTKDNLLTLGDTVSVTVLADYDANVTVTCSSAAVEQDGQPVANDDGTRTFTFKVVKITKDYETLTFTATATKDNDQVTATQSKGVNLRNRVTVTVKESDGSVIDDATVILNHKYPEWNASPKLNYAGGMYCTDAWAVANQPFESVTIELLDGRSAKITDYKNGTLLSAIQAGTEAIDLEYQFPAYQITGKLYVNGTPAKYTSGASTNQYTKTISGVYQTEIPYGELTAWAENLVKTDLDAENAPSKVEAKVYKDGGTYAPETKYGENNVRHNYVMVDVTTYYDVTFNAGDHGTLANGEIGTATYVCGATFPDAPALTAEKHFEFDGWYDGDTKVETFPEKVTESVTYTAHWKQISTDPIEVTPVAAAYKVEHYKENLDGTYTLADTDFPLYGELGENVTAEAKTYAHYSLDEANANAVSSGKVVMPSLGEDSAPVILTLKLYYKLDTFIVTFQAGENGKLNETAESVADTYKYGAAFPVAPTTTPDKHFEFNGWYDGDTKVETLPEKVTESVTYTAHWKQVSTDPGEVTPVAAAYKVEHYKENLDGTYTLADFEYLSDKIGEPVTAEAKTYAHYSLDEANANAVPSGEVVMPSVGEDSAPVILTLKLYYKLDTFTVTFDSNGGSAVAAQTVKYNAKATEPNAPTKDGYSFKGWLLDGAEYDFESPVTGDITLTANFVDDIAPTFQFENTNGAPAASRTVTLIASEPIQAPDGWTEVEGSNGTKWQKTFMKNTKITGFTVTDLAGNVSEPQTLDVKGVDSTVPTGTVTYSTTDPTNQDVTVTLNTSTDCETPEGWTKVNWKIFTKVYTENGSETITLISRTGIEAEETIEVSVQNIDKIAPVVTYRVYGDQVRITADETLQQIPSWTKKNDGLEWRKTLTAGKNYTLTVMDLAGNEVILTIDRILPEISGVEDGTSYCAAQNVTVTDASGIAAVTVNDSAVTPDATGAFTLAAAEGEQKVVVTDSVGNTATVTVTVNSDHTWDEGEVTTEPTCTDKGVKTYTCTVCSETKQEDVLASGHSFTNYVSNNNATCTEDGTKTAKCDYCEETDTVTDEDSALGHVDRTYPAKQYLVSPATCTENAVYHYSCGRCNVVLEKTFEQKDTALGHSFTNYVSNGDATCTEDGTKTAKCDRCEETDTLPDADSKLGHDWVDKGKIDATCTTPEYTLQQCNNDPTHIQQIITGNALGHNYTEVVTDPTCTASGYTTFTCERCGESHIGNITAPTGHIWDGGTVITEAGCAADGVMKYTCTACGATKQENIGATGHSFVEIEHDSTCTECGWITHTCSKCGYTYDSDHVAALGHDYKENVIDPTCTTVGYTKYTCQRDGCNAHYTDNIVQANSHNYETVVEDPTCTAMGKTWKVCSVCDDKVLADVADALGHEFSADWTVDVEPACETSGSKSHHCSRCEAKSDVTVIPALGHDWNDGEITTPATCEGEGVKTFTCGNDTSHTYTEQIPSTGHDYNDGVVTTEATCTENGVKTFTCKNDANHTYTEVISATGHTWNNGAVTKQPEYGVKGEKTYTCTACGATRVEEIPALVYVPTRPVKPAKPELPFTDVSKTDDCYDAVKYVYENKLMVGTSDTSFSPDATFNRAMVATILYRLEKEPATAYSSIFKDVANGSWYAEAVLWAAETGIVNGYGNGRFGAEDAVTVEQLLTILFRYATSEGYDTTARGSLNRITDSEYISAWANDAVSWAVAEDLVASKGALNPTTPATRAQVAEILMHFCENVLSK